MYVMPENFVWGAATAAFQAEGGLDCDGAGESNWLRFCRQPGRIKNGDIPTTGCDQYHLFREDVALMKRLGIGAYRFSLSWARVFPRENVLNEKGLAYYQSLVDALLEAGIEPYVTIFHWDLPQYIEDQGGWRTKDTSRKLGDFASFMAKSFGGKVRHYFTVNEITMFTAAGHNGSGMAPGLKLPRQDIYQTIHHGNLAHGYVAQALHAAAPHAEIGIANNPGIVVPLFETAENIDAARRAARFANAWRHTAIEEGSYPDEFLEKAGSDAPRFTDEEMKVISTPTDFTGFNVYTGNYCTADSESPQGFKLFPGAADHPYMDLSWLRVVPTSIYYGAKFIHELWGKTTYVTENGCSSADTLGDGGEIYDSGRIEYLRNYLRNLQRATAENIPVKGYFVWSLLDNFEWAQGFAPRFGIVYTDYATRKRIPKWSARYYSECIRSNAVL
ncbi:MAG: family 1 glycosylhydrolase [Victivallaceae bacterium]|nr:family 1 glycosylhydrolase [Victivallaceae bacterium]